LKNGQLQHLNPWQKVGLFLIVFFFAIVFTSALSQFLGSVLLNSDEPFEIMNDLTRIDGIRMMKIGNLIAHIVAFIIPAVLLTKLYNFDPKEAILFNKPNSKFCLLIPLLFILLTLVNNGLHWVNHQVDFSFISKSTQESLEYQQAVQDKIIYAYIGETWRSYFVNLFLLAIVPAISEELLFRGLIQNIFSKATQNVWVGITFSALVFALIHAQPFNVLPLFALAVCYGIIVAFTGSLWIAIALHFMNNALMLSFEHLGRRYQLDELYIPSYLGVILLAGSIAIIFWLVKTKKLPNRWNKTTGIYLR